MSRSTNSTIAPAWAGAKSTSAELSAATMSLKPSRRIAANRGDNRAAGMEGSEIEIQISTPWGSYRSAPSREKMRSSMPAMPLFRMLDAARRSSEPSNLHRSEQSVSQWQGAIEVLGGSGTGKNLQ